MIRYYLIENQAMRPLPPNMNSDDYSDDERERMRDMRQGKHGDFGPSG